MKILTVRLVAVAMLVATVAGCSSGSDGPSPGAGQFSATSTTRPAGSAGSTSTTGVVAPETPEEFSDAEHSNDAERSGEDLDWVEGTVTDLDLSDPRETALGWGCALRSKPAGESSEAWALRLSPPATTKAREKLASITSRAVAATDRAAITGGYLEDESAGVQRWRVDCEVVTFGPSGDRVGYDSATPVHVVLVESDGRWLVDDFGWAGIELEG